MRGLHLKAAILAASGIWLIVGTCLPAQAVTAKAASDTSRSTPPLFTARDIYVAAGVVLGTAALAPLDWKYPERLQRADLQKNQLLRNAASAFRAWGGGGVFIGTATAYGIGRVFHQPALVDLALHTTEAIVVSGAATGVIKGLVGRARPDATPVADPEYFEFAAGVRRGNAYASLPSGHVTVVFAAAAAVTAESSRRWKHSTWVVGPLMFGAATLTGVSRLYHGRHWPSDVVMGAAVGTFTGFKVVRFQHEHPRNRIDRWLLSARVAPTASGMAVGWTWPIP